MSNLETLVLSIVKDFMAREELFTALDISNKVKEVSPQTSHRTTRDVVRGLFASEIETQGWARTPITVNLTDGTTADALLYHPLTDSWDLDNKYDAQKRAQTSSRPVQAAQAAVAQAQATAPVASSTPAPTPVVVATTPMPTARTLWNQMFQTQPSLFPHK